MPASQRVSARELLQDPFLSSDESWMVYARGAGNLKPFLNENEMDRLKLEDDELGRTQMTITGRLKAEDNTILLEVIIADENGKRDLVYLADDFLISQSHDCFFLVPGMAKKVAFPFGIMNDTSIDVAMEMVKELEITDWDPVEIAEMIDGEISSLVPGWRYEEGDETPHVYHSSSSSQASFSNYMTRGRQDWLQGMESNYQI